MLDIKALEEFVVNSLKPLATSRKVISYANPADYDLFNVPANGLGLVYVSIESVDVGETSNKRFGPVLLQPIARIKLKLAQRGGHSHKLCYPTLEQIVTILNGLDYAGSRLIFGGWRHMPEDEKDKCWRYDVDFSFAFDLAVDNC